MCIPKIEPGAALASNIPSMASADNLSIGAGKKAASASLLGRLALRSQAPKKAAATAASPVAALGFGGSQAAGEFSNVPNQDLRIPIGEGL